MSAESGHPSFLFHDAKVWQKDLYGFYGNLRIIIYP